MRAEWLQNRARLHDVATGLPTLPAVVDEVRRELEDHGSIALLAFALATERQVEETWGWQFYDDLIRDFVKGLRGMTERGDFPTGLFCVPAVRSDEILCFVPTKARNGSELPPHEWLRTLAARMDGFAASFLAERLTSVDRYSSHVGQAFILFDPKVRVERAVYRGLSEARGEVFQRTATAEERGTEILRGILAEQRIVSLFQPIHDLVEGRVTGIEALSRGPAGSGLEDAERLFSLAEKAELVIPLERLCRQRSLQEAARAGWERLVFLNMSPAAAQDTEFLDGRLVREVLDLYLDPRQIVIEVTERTYAENQELFAGVLGELRKEGFRIAVDDLGSGYSNLSALADIRPEFLKFDHLFTKDIHRNRIKQDLLGAILSFAMKMDTQVIAEGIESLDELEALRRLGVPLGQGFYLGRPGPIGEIAA
jgi:EAL domain-containing protein (putative c-di-GMP-specific phosphodiesterase class I)/GGDEF domain-containing protein